MKIVWIEVVLQLWWYYYNFKNIDGDPRHVVTPRLKAWYSVCGTL